MRETILRVAGLSKTYASGHTALDDVTLDIEKGEILALLGPNGAGKTTLISIICGLVRPTGGTVSVAGHDIVNDYREARRMIGLVPQEIVLEPFEKVMDTVRFSRGLFGLKKDPAHIERLLRMLSLWDKRDASTKELSGGMKRRCLIAKALSHEPKILFLDEPTAGVDVELRKDMWAIVGRLKEEGVTTILTTHYIEEAEAIADRVGVISGGRILLVEEKAALMQRLGRRQMRLHLTESIAEVPASLDQYGLTLAQDGQALEYTYAASDTAIGTLLSDMQAAGLGVADIDTHQRSLEEIFVELVHNGDDHAKGDAQ
ncbi:ABC transporter ATP-binding protein [Acuticoccus sp. MNP-M23]|uniref:ABC transporter ATP-binding protein n=1 Tax=Acuticoccus sp. MNP-M23 TaxID=3072793 RepID=UPI002814CE5E|nr:ABC transporter ATP-binding protein [Acuticoccus sp. MNP-M23]WMS42204.1 ABC transporter ATP-binding protein [Acuticoccus sp. MNP-M23]